MAACDVHHVAEGPDDAPVLVLGPSLGTTSAMWDPQVPALAGRLRVVRYDTRGHGASPVPPGPYEIADLGADVLALLDRLGVERASFCGLSIGGMTGMWLAAHAPERIDRLVLCCTSAHMGPPEMWAQRAATVLETGGTAAIAGPVVERWLTPAFARRHPEIAAHLRAMLESSPPEGYAACCGAIERMDLRADLAAITAPTVVVAGRDDTATPLEHAETITAGIAGARLAVIADAAHVANVEQPEAVTRQILDHVDPGRSR